MPFRITVMPVMAVEDCVATGRYDAVLAVMPESECSDLFPWPDVGSVPRVVVAVSDLGRRRPLTEAQVAAVKASGQSVVLPDPSHARAIVEFGRRAEAEGWRSVLVHCHAAVSRSPAAALILAAMQDGPGREAESAERVSRMSPFCDFAPNMTLVGFADDLLGRGGALSAACVERFYAVEYAVEYDDELGRRGIQVERPSPAAP